jgi:hypothetical protein
MSDADENAENINRGGDDGYADHDENHDDYSDEGDAELKERKGTMSIADLYVPSHITKHRIVTGGRTPKQLQFLTEWHPGWTADISLAKSVIRKHPIESVYFVNYKPSWEPYSEYYDTITPNMIEDYKTDSGVKTFGSTIDKLVEDLSLKQRRSLKAEDIYPNYEFEYNEVSESDSGQDDHEVEGALTNPQIRKKRGRPKKDKAARPRSVLAERTPDCGCAKDCRNAFDGVHRKHIRDEFQSITDFTKRSTWLSNLVEISPCPFRGAALQLRAKRIKRYQAKYFFVKKGKRILVCKPFFQATLSIGNTTLLNLSDHIFDHRSFQQVERIDKRGKHRPKHGASEETSDILRRHILQFPRERSHYTLGKKEMLNPSLNVKKMWQLYKEQEESKDRRVLLYGAYLKEFNKHGLRFAPYKTDTCGTCDELNNQLIVDPTNEELLEKKKTHLREADMGFKMQKADRESASAETHEAIWGDMMSVLQIPKLPTGAAFYKRKYKVYNEDFYSASRNEHNMFLWGQLEGKKGANDVISCLHQFLETVPDGCKHLICWFDGTSSQLKNTSTLLYLLHRTDSTSPLYKFERICVKHAVPGHTFMPPDRAFGDVSRKLKKHEVIGDPTEIKDIINKQSKNTKAEWIPRDHHFDWGSYLSQYYSTDKKFMRVDDVPLLMKSRWFSFGFCQVQDENGESILVQQFTNEIRSRLSFNTKSEWKSFRVDKQKTKSPRSFSDFVAYPEQLHLERARIKDLAQQREWLPVKYRELDIYNLDSSKSSDSELQSSSSDDAAAEQSDEESA